MNTQNAIVTVSANFRSHKCHFSRSKSAKERWTKPVSKAFYEKLRLRCEQIFEEMRYGCGWVVNFMPAVDKYISTGETPGMCDEGIRIVFICLRHEIDMALERSAKARKRAAERREAKEAAQTTTPADEPRQEETGTLPTDTSDAVTPDCKAETLSPPTGPVSEIRIQRNNREESS